MSTAVRRYLDPSEAVHAFLDWSTSFAVTCEGPLDQAAMAEAVTMLAASAPLMRGYIGKTERGFEFLVPVDGRPEVVTGTASHAACLEAMGTPLDSSRSLARVTVLPGAKVSYVVLVLHHAIADAPNCIALFALLWENYSAVLAGQARAPGTGEVILPSSAEHLFHASGAGSGWQPESWRDEAAAVGAELAAAAGVIRLARVVPDRIRLDEQSTKLLADAVRDAGLSLHSYVCAATLIACRAAGLWADIGDRPLRLGCPTDLRGVLPVPVTATQVTNLSDGIDTEVFLGSDDPVEVARQLGEGLHKAIDSGQAERALLDPRYKRPRAGLPVDHVVSNVGTIPVPVTPAGLRITDFHGYQSQTISGATLHVVSLYAGQLSVELISPEGLLSDEQRGQITGHTRTLLRGMAPR